MRFSTIGNDRIDKECIKIQNQMLPNTPQNINLAALPFFALQMGRIERQISFTKRAQIFMFPL